MRKIITDKIKRDIEPLKSLLELINGGVQSIDARGLTSAARSLLAALLFERLENFLMIICPEEKDALACTADLSLFLNEEDVLYYPPLDFLAIDMFALQKEEALARLAVMTDLQIKTKGVIVTCAAAVMQKVMPFTEFQRYLQIISCGDLLNRERFCEHLAAGGYRRVSLVEEKGEFSVRGSILDVFPPAEKDPLRLEMSGDEIESIRKFDPTSQRSTGRADAFVVAPANEIVMNSQTLELAVRNIKRRADSLSLPREIRSRLVETLQNGLAESINPIFLPLFYEVYDETGSFSKNELSGFFDYLPRNTLAVLNDPLAIRRAVLSMENNIDKLLFKAANTNKFHLDKKSAYINPVIIQASLTKLPRLNLEGLVLDEDKERTAPAVRFETYKDIFAVQPSQGEIKEDALFRQTVGKIKLYFCNFRF